MDIRLVSQNIPATVWINMLIHYHNGNGTVVYSANLLVLILYHVLLQNNTEFMQVFIYIRGFNDTLNK